MQVSSGAVPLETGAGARFPDLARRFFGNVRFQFHEAEHPHAELASADFGPCRLSRVKASAHGVSGMRVVQHSHDVDAVKLILQTDGRSVFEQNGVSLILGPGSMLIYDPTRPYTLDNTSPIEQILLQIPRGNFPLAMLQNLTSRQLFSGESDGVSRIVACLVRTAMEEAAMLDEVARARVGDTLVRLAASLAGEPDDADAGRDSTSLKILRARVKAYVESHLARPSLDVDEIARRMGCSRRYVFRAFELEETTPSGFIWDLRLARARDRLSDPGFRSSTISEIAFSCGFSSSAHFSRAFRKHFGLSPREARRGD